MQALELDNKSFAGAGAVRQLAAGHAFRLTQHEHYAPGEDRFTVLLVNHTAREGGFNQWQVDDTPDQLRTRLASSTAATQLNLGLPDPAVAYVGPARQLSRQRVRAARTDAWGMLRAGEGMLISTMARARQGSGIASTQLDAAEAIACLKGAKELSKAIATAAAQQNALVSKDANAAQADFITQIDPKEKGKYDGAVNGRSAPKAKAGSRDLDAAQPVEKFATPLVVLEAPSTINWATPASTVMFAGQQVHWTTQADMHLTAGPTVAAVSANAASFFTHAGDIQAIAGNAPVSLQSHTDQLEILADKSIVVISVNDAIDIKASQKIRLQAGQSSITLEGGNITFACPDNFTAKGVQHLFDSGRENAAKFKRLPDTRIHPFDEHFHVEDEVTGAKLADLPYRMLRPSAGEEIPMP